MELIKIQIHTFRPLLIFTALSQISEFCHIFTNKGPSDAESISEKTRLLLSVLWNQLVVPTLTVASDLASEGSGDATF